MGHSDAKDHGRILEAGQCEETDSPLAPNPKGLQPDDPLQNSNLPELQKSPFGTSSAITL